MERYKNNGSLIDFEDHKKKFEMDEKEEQCIRIAALCHDLGKGKNCVSLYSLSS